MKDNFNKKYIIITKDLQKSLIEFLDEVQFDVAGESNKDSMHTVNFCNWAINELLDGYEAFFKDEKKKKSRQDYVDETFMDWNLPEMTDKEYEKLVDSFDNFLRGWEEEYKKKNPQKKSKQRRKSKPKSDKDYVPPFEDVAEYMSLEEIKEYLLEDEELSDEERFDLYYEEHRRVEDKKDSISYEQLLKGAGVKPSNWKPKKK